MILRYRFLILVLLFLFSLSLVSAISVDDFSLADLGFNGFVVEANLDTSGTAQVLYGKTGALGSSTSLVSSSSEHLLQVDGLQENTVYFYRVVGKDSSGNSYSSAISLTRTPSNAESTSSSTPQGDNGLLINNQAVFTQAQVVKIRKRLDDGWNHPSGPGYPDDKAYLIEMKNRFMANPNVGQWDNFDLDDGADTADSPISAYGVSDEIHYAAIYAYLYDDKEVAQTVANRIVKYAQDPDLDIAQKVKDNNFRTRNTRASNTWLFIAPKMMKFLDSYALVSGLAKVSSVNDREVANWFKDWRDFNYDGADFHMDVAWGADWNKNVYKKTGYNYLLPGDHPNGELFTDSNGNVIPSYSTTRAHGSVHNINTVFWTYIHAYGVYYNHALSRDETFEFWKSSLRLGYFADGTSSEMIRSVTPSSYKSSGYENLGPVYVGITLSYIAKAAMLEKVAFENGLLGVAEPNRWFDYSTSQGTADYTGLRGHTAASTSGGPKSLLSVTQAYLKFYRQYGDQGWSPRRYVKGETLLQGDFSNMNHRILAAVLNTHYQNSDLEAGWKKDISYGYAPMSMYPRSSMSKHNAGPHEILYGLMYWADLEI